MENFRRLLQFFLQFFGKFLQFFRNFLQFFWKIFPKIFAIFFNLCDFPTIFPENFSENFSENSRSQSVTVQPGFSRGSTGVSPYCKFTIKFTSRITPKFTLILIKILQSTKFEGSHFFNSLSTFTDTNRISKPSYLLSSLCAPFPSPPCFLDHSSAVPKAPMAVPPLATSEVCGQYEGL